MAHDAAVRDGAKGVPPGGCPECKNKPGEPFRINKTSQKRTQNERKRTQTDPNSNPDSSYDVITCWVISPCSDEITNETAGRFGNKGRGCDEGEKPTGRLLEEPP